MAIGLDKDPHFITYYFRSHWEDFDYTPARVLHLFVSHDFEIQLLSKVSSTGYSS